MNMIIVDDETDTLQEIEFYVKKYGGFNSCVLCSNGMEALAQAETTSFDIALLDIEMPMMTGLELAERLISRYPDLGIAFITAYNNYATEAFELNAIDYVLKPIREERLYKALDKLFSRKADPAQTSENEPELNIQTLGRLAVRAGDKVLKWNRQKSVEVFAYLLMHHGKPVHKEKLCDILWPDYNPQKALVNLQTAMCQVRKTLSAFDREQIAVEYLENCYRVILGKGYHDAEEFEALSKKVLNAEDNSLEALEYAIEIYHGGFLEEQGWLWSVPLRERLEIKYKLLLEKLIERCIENGRVERVPEYLNKLLEILPANDTLIERYISEVNRLGRKEEARALFEKIKKIYKEY
jgi:two-component SAPR family response regulator